MASNCLPSVCQCRRAPDRQRAGSRRRQSSRDSAVQTSSTTSIITFGSRSAVSTPTVRCAHGRVTTVVGRRRDRRQGTVLTATTSRGSSSRPARQPCPRTTGACGHRARSADAAPEADRPPIAAKRPLSLTVERPFVGPVSFGFSMHPGDGAPVRGSGSRPGSELPPLSRIPCHPTAMRRAGGRRRTDARAPS